MSKWERPSQPPAPMFLGEKERNLVKQINDEIIERVVGQQVLYFPIDIDITEYHPLNGEGDFVRFGSIYYEIVKLNEPKLLFGQPESRFEISADCIRARDGLFNAE